MTKIESIEFHNYRQYRNIKVEFPSNGENEIHILKAKNGTGKTTFLKGILWCLYEKENYITDKNKALKIINENLVQELKEGDIAETIVKIIVSDEEFVIEFERKQKFNIMKDPFLNKQHAKECGPAELIIKKTSKNDISNTQVLDNEFADTIVKQYFDEAIHDYYFFDGENLKNYFNATNSTNIKNSIFNISQVTLLENAIRHTKSLCSEKQKKYGGIVNIDPKLYEEIERLEKKIKRLQDENTNIDIELPKIQGEINRYQEMLKGYAPIKSQQEKRERVKSEIDIFTEEYKKLIEDKEDFLRKYYILLKFYPYMKKSLELIIEKDNAGQLPPSVDKLQLQEILRKNIPCCPVCANDITQNSLNHIKEMLKKIEVSAKASNYLIGLKGVLEIHIEEAQKYEERKRELIEREKYYKEEIASREEILKEISAFLSNYSGNEAIDIRDIESKLKLANDKYSNRKATKIVNNSTIVTDNIELKLKKADLQKLEEKAKDKDSLIKQVNVLRNVSENLESIKNDIMNEIKSEIQNKTWEYFDNMIWKKNTFKKIAIDDSYQMTVYNINDNEMTGSLSATEYMALAYSFTFAIHEASGKNCPLVVDSPLGRVSDENRVNMAKELLKVSKEKQIIMLFTPDEYSSEVAEVYDNKSSTNRIITLSDDEKNIEKVGK